MPSFPNKLFTFLRSTYTIRRLQDLLIFTLLKRHHVFNLLCKIRLNNHMSDGKSPQRAQIRKFDIIITSPFSRNNPIHSWHSLNIHNFNGNTVCIQATVPKRKFKTDMLLTSNIKWEIYFLLACVCAFISFHRKASHDWTKQ